MYLDSLDGLKFFYERNDLTFLRIVLKIMLKDEGDRTVVIPKDACMFERHLSGGNVRTSPVVSVARRRHIR